MSRRKQAKPARILEDEATLNGDGSEAPAVVGDKLTEECGLGSSSDHGEQSSINSGGDSTHLRDSTGEMASEEGHENDSSDNGEPRPQSDTSPNLFLKRSADEDLVNNNDHRRRRQRLDGGEENDSANDENEPMDDNDEEESKKRIKDSANNEMEEKQRKNSSNTGSHPVGFPSSLLNMNMAGGLSEDKEKSDKPNINPQKAAEQLKTIAETISQLTANVANNSNPKTVQELAVLQATLFSLQQQQLLQMQILTQMQMQQGSDGLKLDIDDLTDGDSDSPSSAMSDLAKKMEMQNSLASPSIPLSSTNLGRKSETGISKTSHGLGANADLDSTPLPPSIPSKSTLANLASLAPNFPPHQPPPRSSSIENKRPLKINSEISASYPPLSPTKSRKSPSPGGSQLDILDPNGPLPSLSSSIIMHHDGPGEEKPSINSLELLQKKAQGILNNASQGLLANNLADFTCGKDQREAYEKKGEPFFKHRCRYCGKVFGSDSALQIHVRSHTGERPYKCNICGNRFTTKGNLKVHFQRHTHKFPHVKMNPNLVPEHLDKFYPSLLQNIEEAEKKGLPPPNVNNPMAGMTPVIPPGFRLPSIPGVPPQSAAALGQLLSGGVPPLTGGPGMPGGPPIPRFPLPPASSPGLHTSLPSSIMSGLSPGLPTSLPSSLAGGLPSSLSSLSSSLVAAGLPPNFPGMAGLPKGLLMPKNPLDLPNEPLKREEAPQNLSKSPFEVRSRSVSPVALNPSIERMSDIEKRYSAFKDSQSNKMSKEDDVEIMCEDSDDDSKPPLKRSRHRTGDEKQRDCEDFSNERDLTASPNALLSSTMKDEMNKGEVKEADKANCDKLTEDEMKQEQQREDSEESGQDEPQNLSKDGSERRRSNSVGGRRQSLSPQRGLIRTIEEARSPIGGGVPGRLFPPLGFPVPPLIPPGGGSPMPAQSPGAPGSLGPRSAPGTPGAPSTPNGQPLPMPPAGFDPAKNPIVYTSLLPRPGSNDNAWETLIEVSKTSETSKLEALVNNIEQKMTDPNECFICHRVLSCKSALQMHYRTHTGERPFKCRICGRAFTTKGNLKTHMGVHRAKPPMRMFHQCPVCHKKYANALVLQQHIRTHTGEPMDLTPEQIEAAEIRDFPPLPFGPPGSMSPFGTRMPGNGFPGFPIGQFPPGFGDGDSPSPDMFDREEKDSNEEKDTEGASRPSSVSSSTSSNLNHSFPPSMLPISTMATLEHLARYTSIDTLPKHSSGTHPFGLLNALQLDKSLQQHGSLPEDLTSPIRKREFDHNGINDKEESGSSPVSPPKFSPDPVAASSPNSNGRPGKEDFSEKSQSRTSSSHDVPINGKSPLTPATQAVLPSDHTKSPAPTSLNSNENREGLSPLPIGDPRNINKGGSNENPAAAAAAAAAAASSLLFPNFPGLLPPGGGFPNPLLAAAASAGSIPGQLPNSVPPTASALSQLNAASALTPPGFNPLGLPFPNIPGIRPARGNTTCHICFKVFACNSALEIHIRSHTKERPFKCKFCDRGFSTKGNMRQHALTHKNSERANSPNSSNTNSDNEQASQADRNRDNEMNDQSDDEAGANTENANEENFGSKRVDHSPTRLNNLHSIDEEKEQRQSSLNGQDDQEDISRSQSNSSSPSSSSSNNKHICRVCKKNFSSGSALQIHMRTHTGDRPFSCTVCGKSFTTKGNLKVHMGTHMWTSAQVSRRGRRMSLELPRPPIPLTAKDSEFLQRRPDLFYPYLQTPFNGKAIPPSMGLENGLLRAAHPESMLDTNGTLETNGKDNNNLPSNIRIPFPPSYGRSLGFGGQPLPPSLRPPFPSEYSSPTLNTSNRHLTSSGKHEERMRHPSNSPDPIRSRSPISVSHRPLEIERVHNSCENKDRNVMDAEDVEMSEYSNSRLSKDNNGVNENDAYNCDGPRQDRKKEDIELSSLLPSNSENSSKMSSESIAT